MTSPRSVPRISAVICTYERYDLLDEAIASLTAQTLPATDFEILIIDNSSDALRSSRKAATFAAIPNLVWYHHAELGLSRARNLAVHHARAPLIAFLDDDARADAQWLEALLAAFATFGEVVKVVGGPVRPLWLSPRPAWLHDALLGHLTVVERGAEQRLLAPEEWLAGANIAFRRAAIEEAGGFDTALGRKGSGAHLLSAEEIALIARIRASGGAVGYAPQAGVAHLIAPERLTQRWFRRRAAWQAVSDYLRDPEASLARAERAWETVKSFLFSRNPADRTLRGLALAETDPEAFRWQVAAIYAAVTALLAGPEETDEL